MLVIYDGLHRLSQRVLSLPDGIHKPLRRIDFLLDKGEGIFLLATCFGSARIRFHHLLVHGAYAQLRRIALIELQPQFVLFNRQQKVRDNLNCLAAAGFCAGIPRLRIQLGDFCQRVLERFFVDVQFLLDAIEMLL